MRLVELSPMEFYNYSFNHLYSSFYQTYEYGLFMQEFGFEYNLLGLKDNYGQIVAASLIVINKLDNKKSFGYAPRGFLIDYSNAELLKEFADALKNYYKNKKVVFIKTNPNINIAIYDKYNNRFMYNYNTQLIDCIRKAKYQELKKVKNFEALIPTYSPIINLREFAYNRLDKNVRNKIRKCYRKGLIIEKGGHDDIKEFYPYLKNKTKKSLKYYQMLFQAFKKRKMVDVFLIKVNFEEYLINTKDKYQKALEVNNILNRMMQIKPTEKVFKRKIQSDRELDILKKEVYFATNGLSKGKTKLIAGAIVLKYKNKATIYASGYNFKYRSLNPNDFMYYKLIEYYKYNLDYLDLDGFSGDLSSDNKYKGLNEFKMGFNPEIFEDIGEYDVVLDNKVYKKIAGDGTLAELFYNLKQ